MGLERVVVDKVPRSNFPLFSCPIFGDGAADGIATHYIHNLSVLVIVDWDLTLRGDGEVSQGVVVLVLLATQVLMGLRMSILPLQDSYPGLY